MRNLMNFSQNDPKWGKEPLGSSADTIGNDGCLDTSFADLACYYGKDTDVERLEEAFLSAKIFISGELLADDSLHQLYPDIQYVTTDNYVNDPADLAKLKTYMSDPTLSVVLCLQLSKTTHFVPVVDCDGTTVMIADSWDGVVKNCNLYGVPKTIITKFIVYKGTLPTMTPPISNDDQNVLNFLHQQPLGSFGNFEAMVRSAVGALKDAAGLKTTIDALNSKIIADGQAAQACDAEVNSLKSQISTLQATVDRLQPEADKVGDLTKAVNQAEIDATGYQNEIISLNKQITTLSATSYTTAQNSVLVGEILRRLMNKLSIKK